MHTGALADLVAVILAGGLGTRLRPVLADLPKSLAPIAGRPFLAWLLDQLAAAGLRRAVISTGYRAEQVRQTLGDRHGPIELVYSHESSPLGTAGALRAALPHLSGPTVLAMNGDSYFQADLAAFRQFHDDRRAAGSLLLAQVPDTARYGRVELDPQGRVTQFAEKTASSGPGWINAGAYLLEIDLVREIPAGRPVSIEREIFPARIGRGLYGFPGAQRFLDIGTPESYAAAESFFATKGVRTILPATEKSSDPFYRRFVVLDRDGTIIVERRYLSEPDQVELLPGAAAGLRRLSALGLGLIVVTNQSGVARGYFDMARVDAIHRRMEDLLAAEGVHLDAIYVCPHLPDANCPCRKPRPGLVHQAAAQFGFQPGECFFIGDKPCDIELGQAVAATTILVRTGYGAEHAAAGTAQPTHLAADLSAAADVIARLLTASLS